MKIILLRGSEQPPIKIHFDKWMLINCLLFLMAITMIVKSTQSMSRNSSKVDKVSAGGVLGISVAPNSRHIDEISLLESIKVSEKKLKKQETRLKLIQNISKEIKSNFAVVDKGLELEALQLYTTPVDTGFISSGYGMRIDPINGRYRKHNGVDIAAKKGSAIRTIGSGFVTFTGRKGGYGKVVEIHHSDSLKSRYAHLSNILVEEGDVVRQGSQIAKMGRTGRATGSHLHLEVWIDGESVNPENYLDLSIDRYVLK